MSGIIIQALAGVLIGAGVGAVVGFGVWALIEKFTSRGGLLALVPSGPLNVGLIGAVVTGIVGIVIGAITGVLGLDTLQAAVVGIVIFALIKGRVLIPNIRSLATATRHYVRGGRLDRGVILMNITDVTLLLEFAIVGVLVALCLRYFFAG